MLLLVAVDWTMRWASTLPVRKLHVRYINFRCNFQSCCDCKVTDIPAKYPSNQNALTSRQTCLKLLWSTEDLINSITLNHLLRNLMVNTVLWTAELWHPVPQYDPGNFENSRGSLDSTETKIRNGRSGFHSRQEQNRIFYHRHRYQTGSGAHLVSYQMGTGNSHPVDKTAGAWSLSFAST